MRLPSGKYWLAKFVQNGIAVLVAALIADHLGISRWMVWAAAFAFHVYMNLSDCVCEAIEEGEKSNDSYKRI